MRWVTPYFNTLPKHAAEVPIKSALLGEKWECHLLCKKKNKVLLNTAPHVPCSESWAWFSHIYVTCFNFDTNISHSFSYSVCEYCTFCIENQFPFMAEQHIGTNDDD